RRVAGAAVPESLHEVRTAVPFSAAIRHRLISAALEIARLPDTDEGAGNRHAVGAVFLPHRLARHEEGVERADVLVRGLGEMVVRESGIEIAAIAIDAIAHA